MGIHQQEEIVPFEDLVSTGILSVSEQAENNQIFFSLYASLSFMLRFDIVSSCLCQQTVMTLDCININEVEWSLFVSADPLSNNSRFIGRGLNFPVWLRRWDAAETGHDLFQTR